MTSSRILNKHLKKSRKIRKIFSTTPKNKEVRINFFNKIFELGLGKDIFFNDKSIMVLNPKTINLLEKEADKYLK